MSQHVSVLFSEPKIPQFARCDAAALIEHRFSALQRAENSSIGRSERSGGDVLVFQCSSASRKFLNLTDFVGDFTDSRFQCSSASRKFLNRCVFRCWDQALKEFQCSSASRKFLNHMFAPEPARGRNEVSVLFSEPKIPQSGGCVV